MEAFLRSAAGMSEREAFGPNLRRVRVQKGILLEQIALATKVSTDLWAGLERNDFSRWPTGIYARAYVRSYAAHIGVDPEATVDDFCRWFPQGDRRAGRVVKEQAALVGHDLQWKDDLGAAVTEERRSAVVVEGGDAPALVFTRAARIIAALSDAVVVITGGISLAAFLHVSWSVTLSVSALLYHGVALVAVGSTPAVWAIDTYLAHRHPATGRPVTDRFRLLSRSEKLS